MRIRTLSLRQFRTYNRLELDLPSGPILLLGANAQGKTSLLEAIAYLALGSSPLTTVDQHLIHWRAAEAELPFAYLKAEVERRSEVTQLEIALERAPLSNGRTRMKKRFKVNQRPVHRAQLAGHLNVVVFLPEDIDLVSGPPESRRRHMDDLLSQVYPEYVEALTAYKRTVSRRNALLRHLREQGGDALQLGPLEERLTHTGVTISQYRQRMITELTRHADRLHQELTGGKAWLQLIYQPNFDTLSPLGQHDLSAVAEAPEPYIDYRPDLHDAYRALFKRRRRDEVQRGMTLIGPHRDELRFLANDVDIGSFGSRGQQRTVVLALRLAALHWLKQITGESPVLLLDEVLAELDKARRTYLLSMLSGVEQTILATTDAEMFPDDFKKKTAMLEVKEGIITPLA